MNENVALLSQLFMQRSACGKRDVMLLGGRIDLHQDNHVRYQATARKVREKVASSKGKA